MSVSWNLWHGCHKKSEGCKYCYVYRHDAKYEINSKEIKKNKIFNLPIEKNKKGEYKVKSGELIYTCFTSDFFLEEADEWRKEAWEIIKERKDCRFLFVTKRIERFNESLPKDWNNEWDNVTVCCTCENQKRANERLPIYVNLPIKHKVIICEPLLENIELSKYLDKGVEEVIVGGESGNDARICNYDWVMNIRRQCIENHVSFRFKQTGAKLLKDNKLYRVKRIFQHEQAKRAKIDFIARKTKSS